MKKNILFVFLFCSIASFIACDNDNENEDTTPMTEFNLPDGCSWIPNLKSENIYRINSLSELEDFVISDKTLNTDVDFKDYALLLIPIGMPDPGHYIEYGVIKEKDRYVINIEVKNGEGFRPMVPAVYHLAFLVNKNEFYIPVTLNISR